MAYDPATIEPRWQAYWLEHQSFRAEIDPSRPKYYVLDMFPYPSGDGLHVGHPVGFTATDILARYKRMRGFNVLHPMGWDAFGLPAEQYAIKTGTHPHITTRRNIDNFRRQIRSLGFSYDWSREIDTTDPGYVKWTQWIFCRLYERGLAYQAEIPVNWCPALGTVLANEEVIDGRSEVGGYPVERVPLKQWMLRITDYAERLLTDLDDLDWPEPVKKMQREWIGRSEGARIRFAVDHHPDTEFEVFTTRPDTLFGATYLVLAPEHPLVDQITAPDQRAAAQAYILATRSKSERARLSETTSKTGVATGASARNPATGESIPIWIADYVLASYGTGAIMAVPGHDQRDFEFAKTFDLPIKEVVSGGNLEVEAHTGDGRAVHSDFLDGLPSKEAVQQMNAWLEAESVGDACVSYKLRDWLFSRQRYWGEPFPVLHHADGTTRIAADEDLPITLPELQDFRPSGDFSPPLARVTDWLEVPDPTGGPPLIRDANTMPQWAGSCWYFLRFTDPENASAPWSEAAEQYWMPVDLYVGGAEHAVLHLLYARFWHKVFYDIGLVHTKEPFQKLVNQGMILGHSYRYWDDNLSDDPHAAPTRFALSQVDLSGETATDRASGNEVREQWITPGDVFRDDDGTPKHPEDHRLVLDEVLEKMSKSRGNVISPDQVIENFGADSMRLYEMFIGPLEKAAPWSADGIKGVRRFLERVWRLLIVESPSGEESLRELSDAPSEPESRLLARTVAGVTDDIEAMRFNTAISKLMILVRDAARFESLARHSAETLTLLLAPFAPHLAEELWSRLGHADSLTQEAWPEAQRELLEEERQKIAVQVNGKRRGEIEVATGASNAEVEAAALALDAVAKHLGGRAVQKVIVVPGRIVNIVG